MKVVIIIPDSGEGGLFQFYSQVVPELARGAEVHLVFASPFHSLTVHKIAGAQCHILSPKDALPELAHLMQGPLAIAPQLARFLAIAQKAWCVASAIEPDVVEVCDWPLSFVPAVIAQSLPYVVQCHGSSGQIAQHDPQNGQGLGHELLHLIEPQLVAAAHRVQTYSHQNAGFWSDMTGRAVEVIRPAFSLPTLSCGVGDQSDVAAVFGRLQRWKGPHILCEALRLLGSTSPRVDWYGGVKPWERSGLTADKFLAEAYPDVWAGKLQHYPAVSRSLVADIQDKAFFSIIPSTWDVFNFTAVEAMAAGRPTIVSAGAGASELVTYGENGFTFANEDPESLATAIDRIMTLSEIRQREVGLAGRETVRNELDPQCIAGQRLAAYDEAIRSFSASPPDRPNSWLTEMFDPSANSTFDLGDLLEALPMRTISSHLKDRFLRKLLRTHSK